ncbi:MAG: N-acetylglucosamine-6-phosphate deacetylase [Anaerorhabdus sp.]
MKIFKCNEIYTSKGIIDGYLHVVDKKVKQITKTYDGVISYDFSGKKIIPGLIDTHNHGIMGFSMRQNVEKEFECNIGYLKGLAACGVTGVFPTCAPNRIGGIIEVAESEQIFGAKILGIHSEGPWLNRVGEKGIKKKQQNVSIEAIKKMIDDSKGWMKVISISPEIEGIEIVEKLAMENNVKLGLAHSDFNYSEAEEAINSRGYSVFTHLGNAMTGLHHRDVGVLGAGLLNQGVYCEIIFDFIHVCKEMVQVMLKVKDKEKVIMISDNSEYTSLLPGVYNGTEDKTTIIIGPDRSMRTETGKIQGSAVPLIEGLKNLVINLGWNIEDAVKLTSNNPGDFYQLKNRGEIKEGNYADFVIIDEKFNVYATVVEGEEVYNQETDIKSLFNNDFIEQHLIK